MENYSGQQSFPPGQGVCNKTSNTGGVQNRFNGLLGTKSVVQQVKQKYVLERNKIIDFKKPAQIKVGV